MISIMMFIGNQIGEVMKEINPRTIPTGMAKKEGKNPINPRIPKVIFELIVPIPVAQTAGSQAIKKLISIGKKII